MLTQGMEAHTSHLKDSLSLLKRGRPLIVETEQANRLTDKLWCLQEKESKAFIRECKNLKVSALSSAYTKYSKKTALLKSLVPELCQQPQAL